MSVAHVRVHRAKQSEHCLGAFTQCAHYQRAAQRAADETAEAIGKPSHAAAGSGETRSQRRRKRQERSSSRFASRLFSKRWRPAIRLGVAGLLSVAFAFGLYLFIAARPSRFVEYIFFTIARDQIKAFGMRHRGIKDKTSEYGLVTGGNLRALENLSKSKIEALRKSGLGKGLSAAQKARIKRMLKIR